ncbi:hypothetical protein F5Y03DRAFT_339017 [Xylaria venustula]|nr:hypothetical protein F5Y03DRAFT_339017 [Xylaria venustula]
MIEFPRQICLFCLISLYSINTSTIPPFEIMSVQSFLSSASGAVKREMPPLTRRPSLYRAPLPINMLGKNIARINRPYSIESRSGPIAGARLISSSSASLLNKNNVATTAGKDKLPTQSKSDNAQNSTPSEEDFKVSFRDLGMNRITKFVVYTTIGILGTMESIFWCQALWRWWIGAGENSE